MIFERNRGLMLMVENGGLVLVGEPAIGRQGCVEVRRILESEMRK